MVFQPTIIVQGGGGTDVSATTATEADVLDGEIFYKADGTQAEGTAKIAIEITQDDYDYITTPDENVYYIIIEEA